MCGIVAEHGGSDPEALERMLERLAHRGPDDRGTVQVNGSWLGHRRLSIVDVGGGRQPLCTRDDSAYLVGNGEVYNHDTLVRAVEQQMMGDVHVGVFLSGGLDSSLVAAIAARIAGSAAAACRRSPSAPRARPISSRPARSPSTSTASTPRSPTRPRTHSSRCPASCARSKSFDPGLVRSAVPNSMLARTTRQHVKVVLTGEGADELFAGYDSMREFSDPEAPDRARAHRRIAAQPQPPALRPRDDAPLRRGARPFLDRNVIAWALRIPPHEKQGEPEKRLLRTKEALAYYRVWREHLQGISAERTLSRFARA